MTQEPCASTNIDCIDSEIQALIDSFMSAVAVAPDLEDAESVERREIDLRDRVGALAAKVLEWDIQAAIDSEKIKEDECVSRGLRSTGKKKVPRQSYCSAPISRLTAGTH